MLLSAPAAVVAVLVAVKLISVVVAGNSAASHYTERNADAMRGDVSTLAIVNVIEPAKALFAAGSLAVLEDRLDVADARFAEVLARTDPAASCPVRINLELVRERQGDIDAWENRPDQARERYTSALALVSDAPPGCFEGNDDPDEQRRAVRNDTAPRLTAKLAGLTAPPPPPPPAAAPPPAAPAAPPAPAAPEEDTSRSGLRLNPEQGDPVDRLRQLLEDAAG